MKNGIFSNVMEKIKEHFDVNCLELNDKESIQKFL